MRVIGLISGTSVDAIDAACVEIEGEPGSHTIHVASFQSVPWDSSCRQSILGACRADAPLQFVTGLNMLVGEKFAEVAILAAHAAVWDLSSITAIATHGQTIWHQPNPISIANSECRGTRQIGDAAVIAVRTGCTVISNFRAADMAAGGQGAPLIPYLDFTLLRSEKETRAVQNIGGIGNVTYLPKGCTKNDVVAFDTGPGNMLIDAMAQQLTGRFYDEGGVAASKGSLNRTILAEVLDMPFFQLKPPRSTGRELFGTSLSEKLLRMGKEHGLTNEDLLHTAVMITVESIRRAYKSILDPIDPIDCVVVGGGGIHNNFLMDSLKSALAPKNVCTNEEFGLNSDAKEATAFALLGYETLHRRPSNILGATGAHCEVILGDITYARMEPLNRP